MKTRVIRALERAVADLELVGVPFAVVGGLAVGVRVEPRFTRDVDFAVSVANDAEAERLVFALQGSGYRVITTVEHETRHRFATARLEAPADLKAIVDVLFASCGIETEIVDAAERLKLTETLAVPVARTGHLIAMKLLSRDDRTRPRDGSDLVALVGAADDAELERASEAVRLIASRGFDRGRDLPALLDRLLADHRGA